MKLFAFDLPVTSTLIIPGALPRHDDQPPVLRIRHREAALSDAMRCDDVYSWSADGALVVTVSGLACYRFSTAADVLSIDIAPGAAPDRVAGLLIATVLPAWLWWRGDIPLHAATVILPGCAAAIALAGPSGVGKSTLLAGLRDQGAVVVADDVARLVWQADGSVEVSGLPSGIQRVLPDGAREWIDVPDAQRRRHARLAAVILLSRREGQDASPWQALAGAAALSGLLAQLHRPNAMRFLGKGGEAMTRLAGGLRRGDLNVWRWHLPDRPDSLASALLSLCPGLERLRASAPDESD